jgi:signal transduction histidine kinase
MKENFIAGMIHDIRNPLSSMVCSLDYMKESEKIQEDEDIYNMLEIASHCAEFIISHVGNFLDISKLEHSKIELTPSPTELIDLIKKIVCMHKFKAENK